MDWDGGLAGETQAPRLPFGAGISTHVTLPHTLAPVLIVRTAAEHVPWDYGWADDAAGYCAKPHAAWDDGAVTAQSYPPLHVHSARAVRRSHTERPQSVPAFQTGAMSLVPFHLGSCRCEKRDAVRGEGAGSFLRLSWGGWGVAALYRCATGMRLATGARWWWWWGGGGGHDG